jgi:hypothetical protein
VSDLGACTNSQLQIQWRTGIPLVPQPERYFANQFHIALHELFHPILRLRRLDRLPLHIIRRIRTAAFEWRYMVNHVSGARARGFAGGRTGVELLEVAFGRRAPLDAASGVARA